MVELDDYCPKKLSVSERRNCPLCYFNVVGHDKMLARNDARFNLELRWLQLEKLWRDSNDAEFRSAICKYAADVRACYACIMSASPLPPVKSCMLSDIYSYAFKDTWVDINNRGRLGKYGYILDRVVKNGYTYIVSPVTGKEYSLHRMVAIAFSDPNWLTLDYRTVVNHKDGNKFNNQISNLEWILPEQNLLHARIMGLGKKATSAQATQIEAYIQTGLCGDPWRMDHVDLENICNRLGINERVVGNVLQSRFGMKKSEVEHLFQEIKP